MDPRERVNNLTETLHAAMDAVKADTWTALPAYVIDYDPVRRTISAQITTLIPVQDINNVVKPVQIKPCLDVPVCFPHGGGFQLTFPLQPGDEVLLVFATRCIDGWWAYGGIQNQVEPRMHDLSDAIAIPGPWSKPKSVAVPAADGSAVQLRSDDGNSYVEINPAGHVTIKAHSGLTADVTGAVSVTSDTSITLSAPGGTITANGNILG